MDPLVQAALPTIFIGISALFIFWSVRGDQRIQNAKCLCSHPRKQHVSIMDWDSDYGDPQHKGPAYVKPGTCRKCRCRAFVSDFRAE